LQVYAWGDNEFEQIGSNFGSLQPTPAIWINSTSSLVISTGERTTFIAVSGDTIYSYGDNSKGQLGRMLGGSTGSGGIELSGCLTASTPTSAFPCGDTTFISTSTLFSS